MADPKSTSNNTMLTSEEMSKVNVEERAALHFGSQVSEAKMRIERRTIQMKDVEHKNPRDPNLQWDREFIAQQEALLRGYEDAKAGAAARGKKLRAMAEAEAKEKEARAAVLAATGANAARV